MGEIKERNRQKSTNSAICVANTDISAIYGTKRLKNLVTVKQASFRNETNSSRFKDRPMTLN